MTKLKCAILATSAISVVYCSPAIAQTEVLPTEEATQEDIIVTAQRRAQSINDVGMAITAFSNADLAKQGVTETADLARVVPGLTFAESQKGAPIYTIRGVGLFEESLAASPAVTVYLDEVGYPFPIMTDLATLDTSRVEVLKGPQGTLYGQNSTGGAINYVSTKPSASMSGNVDVGLNNFGGFVGSAAIGGPITADLRTRIAVGYDKGGAWQDSYTRDDKNGSKNLLRGRVQLEWTPSAALNIGLSVAGFRDRSDTVAAALYRVTPQVPAAVTPEVAAQVPAPFEPGVADWDANRSLRAKRDYYTASLKGALELSDTVSLISTTSYQNYKQDNFRDTDGSELNVFSVQQTGSVKSFLQELRLVGSMFGDRAEFTLGGSYARDKTEEANTAFVVRTSSARSFLRFGIPPFAASLASDEQKMTTKAVFGNIEFKLSDTLSVIGGLRYTDYRNEFAGCSIDVDGNLAAGLTIIQGVIKSRMTPTRPVIPIPRGTCITLDAVTADPGIHYATLEQDNLSWRAGVNFKPSSSTLFYLTASRGYKSGSFPNINASSTLALRPVNQESVLAFEGGVKADVTASTHIDAAVFYYDYKDKQLRGRIIDPVQGALEALVNVPKSRAWGVEASIVTRPIDGLTLRAGGLYLNTEVTKDFFNFNPFGVAANFLGDDYPFSPRWSFNASADYETPISTDLDIFVGASISSQSDSTSAFGGSPLVTIDGYQLVSARLGVANESQRWRATLWVKNLFNQYYWTDTFRQVDNLSRHVGMGRSAGIRFAYDF